MRLLAPAFTDAWKTLDIDYTSVRTTEDRQTRAVQKFWQGSSTTRAGWPCKEPMRAGTRARETYHYAERSGEERGRRGFVCPDCSARCYEVSGRENWFFKLSEFQDKLLAFYDEHPDFIERSGRRSEIISFMKGGLQDPVHPARLRLGRPRCRGMRAASFYVHCWATAHLDHLTGIGYGDPERTSEFDRRWPIQYHFVGKRRHPLPLRYLAGHARMPACHHAHGVRPRFSAHQGEKMSEVEGNGLMPADLVRVFGVDAYRYYFMSDVQFGHDGSISMERMVQVYNADLANTWGNLVSRDEHDHESTSEATCQACVRSFCLCVSEDNPLREIADGLYAELRRLHGRGGLHRGRGGRAKAGEPREPVRGERPLDVGEKDRACR